MSEELVKRLREWNRQYSGKMPDDIVAASDLIESLRQQLETERMRLAACGVVALSNTPESAAKARDMLPDYRSASCDDVARAVDREMELRQQVTQLRDALKKYAPFDSELEQYSIEALAATAPKEQKQ